MSATAVMHHTTRLATRGQKVEGPVEGQGRSGGRRMPNPRPTRAPRRGAEDERGEDPEPVVTSDESELEWEEDPKEEMRTWRLKRARSGADNRILPGTAPAFEEARQNPRGSGGTSAAMANAIVKMRKLEADRVAARGAPHSERMAAREEYEAAKAARVRMQQRAAMAAMHEIQQRARTKGEEEKRWLQELARAEKEECAAVNEDPTYAPATALATQPPTQPGADRPSTHGSTNPPGSPGPRGKQGPSDPARQDVAPREGVYGRRQTMAATSRHVDLAGWTRRSQRRRGAGPWWWGSANSGYCGRAGEGAMAIPQGHPKARTPAAVIRSSGGCPRIPAVLGADGVCVRGPAMGSDSGGGMARGSHGGAGDPGRQAPR
ncbi:uncharacterized protein LOC122756659 [Drosophila santomea]|uniref:uncharacterized protein LOC122756659 n=1 Tax=Drosophila santomea TaxID=129105 RepID=UPI001CCE00A9|nr:uncharacterized protein LOC122756659 [Drosophila santomea]